MKIIPSAALLLAVAALLATRSAAEEPNEKPKLLPDKADRSVAHSPGDSVARVPDLASVLIRGENRIIRCTKTDPSKNPNAPRIVSVYPVLALVPNPTPKSGLPNVVWDLDRDDDSGLTTLQFRVARFVPELEKVIRAAVGEQNKEGLRQDGLKPAQLDVQPLTLEHAVIDCRVGQEVIATAETESLSSIGHEIRFAMEFTNEALKKFLSKKPVFRFAYSYGRVSVAYGEASTTIKDDVVNKLKEHVRNLTGDASSATQVILANQMKHLIQSTNTTIRRIVRASDPAILAHLTQPITALESLFKREERDWDKLGGTLLSKLAEVLTPLIESNKDIAKRDWTHLDETVKTNDTTRNIGGSVSFTKPLVELKADAKKERVDKLVQTLKTEYGIHVEEDKEKKSLRPVKVDVYLLTEAKGEKALSDTIQIHLRIGKLTGYVQDTDVPLSWTVDKVVAFCNGENGKLDAQAKADAEAKGKLAQAQAKTKVLEELADLKKKAEAQRDKFDKHAKPADDDTVQDRRVRQLFADKVDEIDKYLTRLSAETEVAQPSAVAFHGKAFEVDIAKVLVDFHGWIPPDDASWNSTPPGYDKGWVHFGTAPLMKVATKFIRSATMFGCPADWRRKNDPKYDPMKGTDIPLGEFDTLAKLTDDFKPGNKVATIDRIRSRPWGLLNEFTVNAGGFPGQLEANKNVLTANRVTLEVTDIFGKTHTIPLGTFATRPLK